jgi:hypothetical protein
MKDIKTDEDAVAVINDLKHYLKARHQLKGITPICDSLEEAVNVVIKQFHLDTDPHSFASFPKTPPPNPRAPQPTPFDAALESFKRRMNGG